MPSNNKREGIPLIRGIGRQNGHNFRWKVLSIYCETGKRIAQEIPFVQLFEETLQRHSQSGSNTLTNQTLLVTCGPASEN